MYYYRLQINWVSLTKKKKGYILAYSCNYIANCCLIAAAAVGGGVG
jgi:hypothetical protein